MKRNEQIQSKSKSTNTVQHNDPIKKPSKYHVNKYNIESLIPCLIVTYTKIRCPYNLMLSFVQ